MHGDRTAESTWEALQHAFLEPAQSSTEFWADVPEFDPAMVVPPEVPSTLFNATTQQSTMQCNTAEEGEMGTITTLNQIGGGSSAFRAMSRACRENA